GCCGTTPEHIRALRQMLDGLPDHIAWHNPETVPKEKKEARTDWKNKIFVELDPPRNDRMEGFMKGVLAFQKAGADVITVADSPVGRPRADSSLLACRIQREAQIMPLPHITCRDR
ncbi:MAG TPA: bifunctional homocysteine S-methyltransferase/methylenetetrahydrofolate reductase, partial [Erysipelotrichaceae bacterium]|nr:bifunctional homocysteine S-methyltransferase/methylenetetrahydrofolate reductase [Erysipelotrichaceae bacterium]